MDNDDIVNYHHSVCKIGPANKMGNAYAIEFYREKVINWIISPVGLEIPHLLERAS